MARGREALADWRKKDCEGEEIIAESFLLYEWWKGKEMMGGNRGFKIVEMGQS